jgi:hypothetical protein
MRYRDHRRTFISFFEVNADSHSTRSIIIESSDTKDPDLHLMDSMSFLHSLAFFFRSLSVKTAFLVLNGRRFPRFFPPALSLSRSLPRSQKLCDVRFILTPVVVDTLKREEKFSPVIPFHCQMSVPVIPVHSIWAIHFFCCPIFVGTMAHHFHPNSFDQPRLSRFRPPQFPASLPTTVPRAFASPPAPSYPSSYRKSSSSRAQFRRAPNMRSTLLRKSEAAVVILHPLECCAVVLHVLCCGVGPAPE